MADAFPFTRPIFMDIVLSSNAKVITLFSYLYTLKKGFLISTLFKAWHISQQSQTRTKSLFVTLMSHTSDPYQHVTCCPTFRHGQGPTHLSLTLSKGAYFVWDFIESKSIENEITHAMI